jgi:hypothetical protein
MSPEYTTHDWLLMGDRYELASDVHAVMLVEELEIEEDVYTLLRGA